MKKKFLRTFLAIILCVGILPFAVRAEAVEDAAAADSFGENFPVANLSASSAPLTRVRVCELVAEALSLPAGGDKNISFSDFDSTNDGYAAVAACVQKGIVSGYSDGTFRPNAVLTRGGAAKILCNAFFGSTTASTLKAQSAPFNDVPVDYVFAGCIAYCAKEGLMSGYANGSFKPVAAANEDDVNWTALSWTALSMSSVAYMTRIKVCKLLTEKLDLPAYTPQESPFKDFGPQDDGYAAAMACVHAGIIVWYPDGTFRPNNPLSRGGVARMLCNALLGPTAAGELAAQSAPFSDVPVDYVFAGHIAYCAKEGLMSGYANGSFKPGNAALIGDVNWNCGKWPVSDSPCGIEYEITGITLRNEQFQPVSEIPTGKFYAEISVKNLSSASIDTVMLAAYDDNGKMLSLQYLYANPEIGQTFVLGTSVDNAAGNIAKFKAFVVPVLGEVVPLAKAVEYPGT